MPRNLQLTQSELYWLLHISGWFSLVFVETINFTFFIVGQFDFDYLLQFISMAVLGIICSHFYKKWFIKPYTFEKKLSSIWLKALYDTLAIAVIMVMITNVIVLALNPEMIFRKELLIGTLGQIMNFSRYVVVWIIIYYMYKILKRNQQMSEEKLLAENNSKSTELELLKSQLNPHFLFNALNSIKALVLIDSEKSREAIIKLSELLRFSLNYERRPLISLQDEVEEVQKYLELEKMRFGSRFHFTLDLAPESRDVKIPPAMLLTLAENAIKHGITHLPDGGSISIKSTVSGNLVNIRVLNSGSLGPENLRGIGLKNIKKRLHTLFGETASFTLFSLDKQTVCASIIYPINRS